MTTQPSPAPLAIRDATAEDLPAFVGILAAGGSRPGKEEASDLAPYRAALREIDAADRSRLLVAEVDGAVVGACQVFAVRHLQERGGLCAEVESLHVAPDRRGGGIGGHLLDAAVEVARGWGCYRVQLTSNSARTDAHRFYERAGFTPSHVGFKRLLPRPSP